MITSAADERINEVRTTNDALIAIFVDGRTLSVPLVLYPRLFHASPEERSEWRLIGDGEGVHWPKIDEDLSAAGLLRGVPAPAMPNPSQQKGSSSPQGGRVTDKRTVHVKPQEGGGWAVIGASSEKPSSVHRTQKEAEQQGRQTARKAATEFVLHDRQGEIRERSTYVNELIPGGWQGPKLQGEEVRESIGEVEEVRESIGGVEEVREYIGEMEELRDPVVEE